MMGVIACKVLGREGLEPFGTEPLVFGDRSPVREETYESVIWRRKEMRRKTGKERRGKEGKKYF
jgi:hypothetical protein